MRGFLCRYIDPEYVRNGAFSDKLDVFSFGVVLLELITGKKPVDSNNSSKVVTLVERVSAMMLQFLPLFIFVIINIKRSFFFF